MTVSVGWAHFRDDVIIRDGLVVREDFLETPTGAPGGEQRLTRVSLVRVERPSWMLRSA